MKKHFKRIMSVLLCALMSLSILPLGLVGASAYGVSNYCATAAAQWGIDHWNDYNSVLLGQGYWDNGGDCANFVSQCLYMGGMDMSGYWNTNGYYCHWASPYGNEYAGSFIRCQQLYNFLISKGAQAIKNPSAAQVSIGDVILFYKPNLSRYGHSAIVIDIVNGTPVVAAHSTGTVKYRSDKAGYDWHLGFSGSDTTLMKLYGTTCVNNNPRNFDVYTASGSQGLYSSSSTSSSKYSNFLSGEYAHIFEVKNTSNGQWGKTFRYGNWGWVKLSGFNYKTHISSCHVDHIFGEWQVVKVANCTQNGQSKRVCKRCGYTETKSTTGGHITDPHATCLTEGYCKICGAKTENPLGHDWDNGKIITAPTCLETGIKTYTCKRDSSHKYTEVVPALGHDYVPGATAPTCTENGTKTYKCSRCSDSYIAYVDPNNTWSDWMTDSSLASTLPSNKVQTKTQYRKRDKSTTTSATSPGSGWVQNGVDHVDTSYGNWSSWSTTSASASSTLQVETRVTYRYGVFVCSNCGNRSPVWGSSYTCPGCNRIGAIKQDSWDCVWSPIAYKDSNYTSGTYGGQNKSYTTSLGDGKKWFFSTNNKDNTEPGTTDTDSTAVVIRTEYRSRTITKTTIYKWYKWSDWSAWRDASYTSSSTREVQTRKMYRYDLAALGHNFTIDTDKAFIQQDKLLNESEATGNCYSKGKLCSRCGAVSPDSTTYKHSFPNWNTERSSYTCIDEENLVYIAYCKNGCGCYILKSDNVHDYVVDHKVQPTCTERGYTVYKCQNHTNETYNADYVDALGHDCLNSEWETITYPTCTQSGSRIRKCARYDACGYYEQEEIPALGHTMVKFDAKHETCLVDGNSEYYYCKNCDKYFSDEDGTHEIEENSWVIPATGHTAGEWVTEYEESCGKAGWECKYCVNEWCDEITECEKHGSHGYLMEEREVPPPPPDYYVVRAENAEYNESTGKWEPTSCAEFGIVYYTCRNCENTDHAHSWLPGVVYAPDEVGILDHDWGDYTVKEPSCVHDGEKYRVCKRCGLEEEHEIIPAEYTEHDYVLKETVESPCTAGTNMELWVCSRCGQTDCDECAGKDTPHYYWTGKPADHDVILDVDNSYNATCTEDGKLHYVCQNCDYCYDTPIPALGHKLEKAETYEPTCTESGYDIYRCTRKGCDHAEKYLTDEPLGHLNSSPFTVTTKATCVSDGLEEQFCARVCNGETCGFKLDEAIIPARSHNMGEWYNVWDDDAENQQCRKRDCLNTDETDKYEACSYTETENHIWSEWVYDGPEAKKHTKTCQIDENETVTASCSFTSRVTKKATCTEDGLRTYTCSVCGGQYTEVISAREHEWDNSDWHITVEPTIDTEGEEKRECRHSEVTDEYEACTATQTRPVDILGANYRVTIHEMGTDGEYDLISDETIFDYIGKEVEAVYTVNTGMFLNEDLSKPSGVVTKDGKLLLELYIDRSIHNISFDDGTTKTDDDLYYDDVITPPDDPEKEGYAFMGWSEDGENVVDVETNVPDRDVEYRAVWEIKKYTITYKYGQVNDNAVYKVINQDYATHVTVPESPKFTGYSFADWDKTTPATMPAEDITITALWNINQYTITFDTDGGSEIDPITQDYDTNVTPPADPTKTGYSFDGWNKEIPEKMPAEDITVTAEWKVNQYTITFDTDGGSKIDPITQDYNTEIAPPKDPEKEGYTFAGWSPEIPEKMPAEDITVTAIWVVNQYTVTWWVEGVKTVDYFNFGDNIILPDKPVISGKLFTEWNPEVPTTMPAEDLVFYAGFVSIEHTATFVVPDEAGSYTDETGTYRIIDKVTFCEGDTALSKMPEIPNDDSRYLAYWEDYSLGNEDIVIKAIYKLKTSDDESELITDKNVEYENGTAKITLSAFAETLNAKVKYGAEPIDVILVLDTSSSMNTEKMSNGKTRLQVLKDTANEFVDNIYSAAVESDAEHRVAIVSYNSSASRLTGSSDNNAFIDVVSNKASIVSTINNLRYGRGTRSDYGLDMAKAILSANKDDSRRKLVIFLTDGVPTESGNFNISFANNAIGVANDIKNIYKTPIYAVGVSIGSNPEAELVANPLTENDKMNKFMHFVSSNYSDATQMNIGESKNADGYYVTADDAESLKKVFDDITAQQISNTITFSNVTFNDTVSEYFTLTLVQEEALRNSLKSEYGVPSENIIITRSDSGTDIVIKDVSPKPVYENNVQIGYGITITFEVSANEKAINAGFYSVSSDEASTIEKDGIAIAKFTIPEDVQISKARTIVKYMIDDEVYAIRETDESGAVVPVESNYATWESGNNTVISDNVIAIEGEYTTPTRTATWIAGEETITRSFHIGEIIVVPDVIAPAGYDFTGWDNSIPFRMGSSDMIFTAQFEKHSHNYVIASVAGLCTEGLETTYICSTCGKVKTEKSEPGVHSYAGKVSMADNQSVASVVCETCGYKYQEETVINYKAGTSENSKDKNLIDLTLDENNISVQPDGTITVTVALDGALANARALYVYRVNPNGTKELVESQKVGQTVMLTLDHFSYYVFTDEIGNTSDAEFGDVECVFNGHKYEPKCDIDNHWDECTVCGDVINTEPHSDGENNRICDVCGRDMKDAATITVTNDRIYFYFKDTADIGAKSTWGKLVYSSSNEKVATVDESGVVMGTGRGRCTITVTVEGTDITKEIKVRTDYRWWQWIHWLLFGCVWYFKRLSFWDIIEFLPQLLQSLSREIFNLLLRFLTFK